MRVGAIFAAVGCLALASCGATLPIMDLNHRGEGEFADFVEAISKHVRCEIHKAVATEYDPKIRTRSVLFGWAAKVALTIRAMDKGNFNPGVTANNSPGVFTFVAAAGVETGGTREMTMTYYLPFDELLQNKREVDLLGRGLDCGSSAEPIAGDLGIDQSLAAAFTAWDGWHTLSEQLQGGPFDTITHHVTFQVVAGVSATPTWKLVNVSASSASPFLAATRTTTNELLITLGPAVLGAHKEVKPSKALDDSFQIERLRSVISRP